MLEALHDIHTMLVFHFIFFFVVPIKIIKKGNYSNSLFLVVPIKITKKGNYSNSLFFVDCNIHTHKQCQL